MSEYIFDQPENVKKAEALIASIGIPSNPKVVTEINREINKPDVNLSTIAELVSRDMSMSAKVIKVAGSPFFGSRKMSSIDQALFCLGVKNFYSIILTSALHDAFENYVKTGNKLMEMFWKHSTIVAKSAAFIAKETRTSVSDLAYMTGLFHDCAIPMFIKKFPDYGDVFPLALGTVPLKALSGSYKSVIGIEDEKYNTDHCMAGYLMAKTWLLPQPVCTAICYHHFKNVDIHEDMVAKQLTAIILLSEYLCQDYDVSHMQGSESLDDWAKLHKPVMTLLGLSVDELRDIKEDLAEVLGGDA